MRSNWVFGALLSKKGGEYMLIKNKLAMIGVCIYWLQCPVPQQLGAQTTVSRSSKTIVASVCDLMRTGSQLHLERVSVRAAVIAGGMHGILLVDPQNRCKHGVTMDAPSRVRDHDDYQSFLDALYGQGGEIGAFRIKGEKGITATFLGTVEYHPNEPRLKWTLQVEHITNISVKPKENRADLR
jgi:hypothetical protein